MNGKCDWIGCNKPAKYKIVDFNIKLCEEHFNIQTEPQITLKQHKLTGLSRTGQNIIRTLSSNGKKIQLSKLQRLTNVQETTFDETLENLVMKEIIVIH